MKTKYLSYPFLVFMLFVFSFQNARSQPSDHTNYGFSSSPLLFTDHIPVRKNTRLIKTDIHVFYIGSNNRVCEYTWYGYWAGGGPIHDSSYSVHANTQLVNNGDEIFFIEQDNNKICRLFFNNGWHVEYINSDMTPVRDSSDIIYQNDTIFYVGYNPNNLRVHNKVCYISRPNSSSGFGSSNYLATSTQNVASNTRIIKTDIYVYYIATNYRIYDIIHANGRWTSSGSYLGGQLPNVKFGSNLENDGNHLFFVGTDRKIYELYWVSGWIGQCTTNAAACLVDSALSTIQYCDKYIYYVGDASGSKKMCWLRSKKYPGFGNDQNILDTTGAEIISNFQVCKITFFPHVFFIAGDSCVNLLIRDSNHVACSIRDYNNPSYNTIKWHSGRLNSTAHNIDIQSYFTLSLIGGSSLHVYYVDSDNHVNVFLREVMNGIDKPGWSLTYEDNFQDSVDTKNLWDPWPDYNGYDVQTLLQDTVNINPDFVQLGYWSRWDNISFGNLTGTGTASIESRQESVNRYTFGSIHPPRMLPYDYTTGWLTTGGTNTALSAYDRVESEWIYRCPDSMQYCKCGMGLPSKTNLSRLDCNLHKVVDLCDNFGWKHDSVDLDGDGTFRKFVPPKFYQKYGWFEIRCRAAKGNKMWSAFWMINKGFSDEIDISEIDGDGRGILSNIYYDDCLDNGDTNGGVSHEYNAVGYRFYDAFYTYACEWEPDYAKFYVNNELISTINKSDIANGDSLIFPRDEMIIYINEYIMNGNAKRMPERFPNSFDIDYVRVFQKSDRLALTLSENYNEEKKKSIVGPQDLNKNQLQKDTNSEPIILIYPNPASEYLYIDANYQDESNLRWEIYNSFQQKVKVGNFIASGTANKIDIEMLPIGYYFIRIIGDQLPVVKKFIIKR